MNQQDVNVIFISNDNYAVLLGVALCSLFENKKGDYPLNVYVIDTGLFAKSKSRLKILEDRYRFAINYVVPDMKIFQQLPLVDLAKGYVAPVETYHRIFLAHFLPPTMKRVIDFDTDIMFRGDIAELFHADLKGKTLGAVADCRQEEKWGYLKRLRESIEWPSTPKDPVYFNAGMVLVDLERWREQKIEEKLVALASAHAEKLWHHEQDLMNVVLMNDYTELPLKFNFLTGQFDVSACPDPTVVHFVGGGKPWYLLSTLPYRNEYLYYAKKTPWKNERYRKLMDIHFAKKYHIYPVAQGAWNLYKKAKKRLRSQRT